MMTHLIICVIMTSLCLALASCEHSGAVSEVRSDLEALQTNTSAGKELDYLRSIVSLSTDRDIDRFLAKVRDFEYEIIDESESSSDDGKTVIVKIRIRTYDFGSEYLAAMNDYLNDGKSEGDPSQDRPEFYEALFGRLSKIESKDYVRDVDIVTYNPKGSGEWVTNIKNNDELQDALLGGMTAEMKALSEE